MKPTRQQILESILTTLNELGRDWEYAGEIGPATPLFTGLGMESLDAVVLATSIQEHYGQPMPFARLFAELGEQRRDLTIYELAVFVENNLGEAMADSAGGGRS